MSEDLIYGDCIEKMERLIEEENNGGGVSMSWVDEFREKLDELGRKNKKHREELKKLRKKSKKVDAEFIRHLKEKYDDDMVSELF